MLLRLLLLMTVVPSVELVVLLWVKEQTSWSATILLVLLTGVVGATLARRQGWQTVDRIQRELANHRMPAAAILDGLLILVAGALLITPGILTDAVGFALLVPASRKVVRSYLRQRFHHRFVIHTTSADPTWNSPRSGPRYHRDEIIDARVVDEDSDDAGKSEST
jgi:UPF0716 protein FxsA